MKQVLQNLRSGFSEVADVPAPALKAGHLLIRSSRSLVSTGTEKTVVEFGKAGWIGKAMQQPSRVQSVIEKIKTDGILPTLDAVRNHSWNRPAPLTAEGEVVAWADRIAYVCHDFEDAVAAGIVRPDDLPAEVSEVVGTRRSAQLNKFIQAMLETISSTGVVGMREPEAAALDAFRSFNFERIYLRPDSVAQAERVIRLLRSLTDWFIENPSQMGEVLPPGSEDAVAAAVRHVSGMTDRFALTLAVEHLGWLPQALPRGA